MCDESECLGLVRWEVEQLVDERVEAEVKGWIAKMEKKIDLSEWESKFADAERYYTDKYEKLEDVVLAEELRRQAILNKDDYCCEFQKRTRTIHEYIPLPGIHEGSFICDKCVAWAVMLKEDAKSRNSGPLERKE